jgi:hypothetical protein
VLTGFIEWAHRIRSCETAGKFQSAIAVSEISANCSARLDITTPVASGRITYWETGDYFAESIEIITEEEIYSKHGILRESETLSRCFKDFLNSLGISPD